MHALPLVVAAVEGGGEAAANTSSLAPVMDAANELVKFGGNLFSTILENPVLVVFVAAGFVTIGLGIVKKLKSTARG